ncbi:MULTISPECIES: glycerol-3-phosphate 1-O-acyltransferase PlsB [unclassified Acinetobacter]|uniref:glycerol-3-phosphate 1-O-acyltransferase PlsB n=1 Tax=unclassified Acinetobacter TaxID=196816 RepID=UPI002934B630|nr:MULTISPECIES: glycerol-3-phosphate 1-O-acyltransferase PlsB [unclassified Acinetobacter]WOE32305.1 glycerol-3-phosphate 1-O-acyltransferase PlsB [Acinetobacter sp. SAAs470]WOE37776.1 glycerol-3-phosphate 1-O-acyltransferase PlsB [Acinetobacter sp. SAAs474]
MSKPFSKFYRNITKTILDKIVTPQVLGNTAELEQNLAQHQQNSQVCYVLEDASISNTVLIDQEAISRGLPSVYSSLEIDILHEDDSILALNETHDKKQNFHYSAKLIRLIEYLEHHPNLDIQLIPVTVLWGRAPQHENSWLKALFADAWTKPNKLKQTLNISLYSRENYIEFHKPVSLRSLLNQAKTETPHFSPAYFIAQQLEQNFTHYKEAILGPDLSDRHNLIHQLLKTEAVQNAIRQESIDHKITILAAESRAKQYLLEIVSDFSYSTLRFAELALTKLWTQLYDGIEVHHFDTVRELAKDYQIVYTPCHRSHIDYLLLSYVIFNRGLMVPHIAAGINLNLPVVGQILRGGGAYFIRRTFNGNQLYTAVFKAYLNSLIRRNTPLEYFIEGGRSRTGLLLPPKKGMLAMTIESHLSTHNKPIAFIPTYFSYEKLLEGTAYLNELSGKPKEAESLWGLVNSIRKIEKIFGRVYVNFGEPILLDPLLQQYHANHLHLNIADKPPIAVMNTVNHVAQEILENINKAVVINPISLISLVLLNNNDFQLEKQALIEQIDHLKEFLQAVKYDDRMIITAHHGAEIIDYAEQLKQVNIISQHQKQYVRVAERQRTLLNYFSNNILHCFILTSIIAQLIQSKQSLSQSELLRHIEHIYPFIQEVFFLKWKQNELSQQLSTILTEFKRQTWIHITDDHINLSTNTNQHMSHFHLLAQLCNHHLSHFILIENLIATYGHKIALDTKTLEAMAKAVLKRCLGHPCLQQQSYFDSATFKSFIHSLEKQGLIQINEDIITTTTHFSNNLQTCFEWYDVTVHQLIKSAIFFTNREINQLQDQIKKKK